MVSSGSSIDEEGEILERVSEKAPPSLPSVSGHAVDRSSRNRDPRSPSQDYTRPSNDSEDRRNRKRPRSGDRSRNNTAQHSRSYGGRDDRYDRRAQVSYADIDHARPKSPRITKDAEDMRNADRWARDPKRPRTISRSPPRSPRNQNRESRRGYYDDRRPRDRRDRDYDRRGDRDYGRRDGSGADGSGRHATGRHGGTSAEDPSRSRYTRDSGRQYKDRQDSIDMRSTQDITDNAGESTAADVIVEPAVDEEKLIEERRKRREAIKAKYKGQGTPLLVTALAASANSPASIQSPMAGLDEPVGSDDTNMSDAGSKPRNVENAQSPLTPMDISRENSPALFTIAKDFVQKDHNVNGDDVESSAADYDPVRDMEEEQRRHGQQQHEDLSAADYDENKSPRDALQPEPKDSTQKTDVEDDFDMFAEGDDDDMFADNPPIKEEKQAGKALPLVAQGKQIEADLLDNWDDPEGYYRVILAEMLDGRYHVQANLGKGSFASVIRAFDTKTERLVAIKMIRNNETLKKAALKEMAILQKLEQADPEDKKHIVRFERSFEHKGHLCLVFEHLSINLREVLKKFGRDIGINLKAVRAYAQQLFLGLAHLRKCNIMHADLKPDNILVNEGRNVLKICDLGSASDASENELTPYLASRFYRAPEIILGVPYDSAIDIWAAGCTLYELYTGKILFTGRSNNQMLRSIMECRGKFSHKMLKRGQFAGLHFDDNLNFRSVEQDKITGKDIVKTINILKPTRELKTRIMSAASASGIVDNSGEVKELHLFIDLLDKCLNLNPEKRCTPIEALRHPFISRIR